MTVVRIGEFCKVASQLQNEFGSLQMAELDSDTRDRIDKVLEVEPVSMFLVDPRHVLSASNNAETSIGQLRSEYSNYFMDMDEHGSLDHTEDGKDMPFNQVENKIKEFSRRIKESSLVSLACSQELEKVKLDEGDGSFYTSFLPLPSRFSEFEPIKIPQTVVTVAVYKSGGIKSQEFMVLGNQSLYELRDKIYCMNDHSNADKTTEDSSSFFLIENIFYNDTRHNNTDYSKYFLDRLKERPFGSMTDLDGEFCYLNCNLKDDAFLTPEDFTSHSMDTQFDQLEINLNQAYLFLHHGNCQHWIVFKEVRLVHPADQQNRLCYPLLIFQSKRRRRKCRICDIYPATQVTVDDRMAPENPCFICDQCYYLFHYDQDRKLLYDDFEVFKYLHE